MKKTETSNVKLYPPTTSYYNRLQALLAKDKEIVTDFDYDKSVITLTISNPVKAAAWRAILPETLTFGNVSLSIIVDCDDYSIKPNVIEAAFDGNPVFSRTYHLVVPKQGLDREFCIFNPDIIQFNNDNFGSLYSLETWTAEDLAREILELPSISICTESTLN